MTWYRLISNVIVNMDVTSFYVVSKKMIKYDYVLDQTHH